MRLDGDEGERLELHIDGYQFPDAGNYWDANWLLVRGHVRHPLGGWTFRDPCLTTFELEQLARWFDGIAEGTVDPDKGYFTEPNLHFTFQATPRPIIETRLAFESAPPWLEERETRSEGAVLLFPLELNDPKAAANSLRTWLATYPVRRASERPVG